MKTLLRGAIRGYQVFVSPVLHAMSGAGGGCRFHPTCSHYCMEALELHGTRSGLWLGIRRLLRCHPWGGQGMDPVPEILTDDLKAGLSSPSGLQGGQRTRN